MRDPDRIDEYIEQLRIIWKANPDLRLAQLLENVAVHEARKTSPQEAEGLTFGELYGRLMSAEAKGSCCMYHMEDDVLFKRLENTYVNPGTDKV